MRITPHEIANRYPLMSDADFIALRADIKANGLREPIVLYRGQILDGRHRYRACIDLGTEPRFELYDGDEASARALAESLNVHRRHLTIAERRAIVMEELKRDPAQSDRSIAKKANTDHKTVAAMRTAAATGGEIPHHDIRVGSDGVAQPAKKSRDTGLVDKRGRAIVLPDGKKLAEERVQEITDLAAAGNNREQIAAAIGITADRVSTLMSRHKIKLNVPKRGRAIDSQRIVRESVAALVGVAQGLALAKDIAFEAPEAGELLTELNESMKSLRALAQKLKEIANG